MRTPGLPKYFKFGKANNMKIQKGFYKFNHESKGLYPGGHFENGEYTSYIFIGKVSDVPYMNTSFITFLPFSYNENKNKWELGTWTREERLLSNDRNKMEPMDKHTVIKTIIDSKEIGKNFYNAILEL